MAAAGGGIPGGGGSGGGGGGGGDSGAGGFRFDIPKGDLTGLEDIQKILQGVSAIVQDMGQKVQGSITGMSTAGEVAVGAVSRAADAVFSVGKATASSITGVARASSIGIDQMVEHFSGSQFGILGGLVGFFADYTRSLDTTYGRMRKEAAVTFDEYAYHMKEMTDLSAETGRSIENVGNAYSIFVSRAMEGLDTSMVGLAGTAVRVSSLVGMAVGDVAENMRSVFYNLRLGDKDIENLYRSAIRVGQTTGATVQEMVGSLQTVSTHAAFMPKGVSEEFMSTALPVSGMSVGMGIPELYTDLQAAVRDVTKTAQLTALVGQAGGVSGAAFQGALGRGDMTEAASLFAEAMKEVGPQMMDQFSRLQQGGVFESIYGTNLRLVSVLSKMPESMREILNASMRAKDQGMDLGQMQQSYTSMQEKMGFAYTTLRAAISDVIARSTFSGIGSTDGILEVITGFADSFRDSIKTLNASDKYAQFDLNAGGVLPPNQMITYFIDMATALFKEVWQHIYPLVVDIFKGILDAFVEAARDKLPGIMSFFLPDTSDASDAAIADRASRDVSGIPRFLVDLTDNVANAMVVANMALASTGPPTNAIDRDAHSLMGVVAGAASSYNQSRNSSIDAKRIAAAIVEERETRGMPTEEASREDLTKLAVATQGAVETVKDVMGGFREDLRPFLGSVATLSRLLERGF
jgi:hypothetical protein